MHGKPNVLVMYRNDAVPDSATIECLEALRRCAYFHVSFMDVTGCACNLTLEPFDGVVILRSCVDAWAVGGDNFLPPTLAAFSGVRACILHQASTANVKTSLRRIVDAMSPQIVTADMPEEQAYAVCENLRCVRYIPIMDGEGSAAAERMCAEFKALLPSTARACIVWGMCAAQCLHDNEDTVRTLAPTGSFPAFVRQETDEGFRGRIVWQRFARENLFAVPSNFIKRAKMHNNAFQIKDFLQVEPVQALLPRCRHDTMTTQVRDVLWN